MGGRACSVCSHRSRAAIDGRLVAGESFRRIATAFNVSASALKRHRDSGHVQEAVEARAEARSTAEKVREHDAKLAELSFSGDLRQQAEALRDHGISLMRRAEARGDDRSAIAAGAMVQRALEMLSEQDASAAAGDDDGWPSVIIYPPEMDGPPAWLTRQLPRVVVWLPDNGRGDSATFNGTVGDDGDVAEVQP